MGIIITLLLTFSNILDPNGSFVTKNTNDTNITVNSTSSILDPNGNN